jgi:diguanylate cyclase (GGDEF)-like protein/putative nucleotidyltransferase with HDIG domain
MAPADKAWMERDGLDKRTGSSTQSDPFDPSVGPVLMARVLCLLFASGALISLLTVILPHSHRASEQGQLAIIAIALLVAGVLHFGSTRLSARVLRGVLALGSTLITGVAYFSGQAPSPLIFFYLWVILISAYFMTVPQMAWQIAYVGIAYLALLLARVPAGGVLVWWLVAMASLVVGAAVIRWLRDCVESLVASLYDASRTDPLTKLTNRRGHREALDLELERARRGGGTLTLLMGDLDHFKEVNDRCGHLVGDAALRRVAAVLEESKRRIDAVARVGGEEFALVLPNTNAHEALVVAERLRLHVRQEFANDVVPLTISFGVATFPDHGQTAGALLRTVDEALYTAKGNGRDMCVIYSSEISELRSELGSRDIASERFLAVVLDLAETVDLRFSGSARHCETVARYAEMIARELGLSKQRTERVRLAGMLHDIGKIGVPNSILGKPGSLTDEEFALIRRHPELGAQILEHESLTDVRSWVAAHHERPDGQGYPLGLKGVEIPIEASIVAVADAFEAMTSNRSYRSAMGIEDARIEVAAHAGTQFDKTVVNALLAILDRASTQAAEVLATA